MAQRNRALLGKVSLTLIFGKSTGFEQIFARIFEKSTGFEQIFTRIFKKSTNSEQISTRIFRFFGNYTLLECSSILSCDNSWRKDLLNELSEDCMIIFNNLALEVNMIELTKAEVIINLLLHLAAIRASQNELPNIPDRPEPLDLYR